MAGYIELDRGELVIWHIGQVVYIEPGNVNSFQADGDELDFVIHHCKGIPFTKERVVKWYGDFAKFIVANLNS